MPRCTIPASPSRRAPLPRGGASPSARRSRALRRLGGLLALTFLLAALPAPALAAPAGDVSAGPGAVLFEWLQGLLARLGVAAVPEASVPDGPTSLKETLSSGMDPDGVTSSGGTDFGETPQVEEGGTDG